LGIAEQYNDKNNALLLSRNQCPILVKLSEVLVHASSTGLYRWIDLFSGTELIALDVLSKTLKKTPGHRKNRAYLVRCPINYMRLINVSMVKVVSTTRCTVAVRCIGCGINAQIVKRLLLLGTNGHDV